MSISGGLNWRMREDGVGERLVGPNQCQVVVADYDGML